MLFKSFALFPVPLFSYIMEQFPLHFILFKTVCAHKIFFYKCKAIFVVLAVYLFFKNKNTSLLSLFSSHVTVNNDKSFEIKDLFQQSV